jgi:hypothetical protein
VQPPTETDRVAFWLVVYLATAISVFVFAVVGRFAP